MKNEEVLDHIEEMIEQIKELAEYKKKSEHEKIIKATNELIDQIQVAIKVSNNLAYNNYHFTDSYDELIKIMSSKELTKMLSFDKINSIDDVTAFIGSLVSSYSLLVNMNLNKQHTIDLLSKELEKQNNSFWKRIWS